MPMIDVYADRGHVRRSGLARPAAGGDADADRAGSGHSDVSEKHRSLCSRTSGSCHCRNVDGDSNYVRVQVLTNSGALNREKQLAVVEQLTELVATEAGDPTLKERTWVLLTEAAPGGSGIVGPRPHQRRARSRRTRRGPPEAERRRSAIEAIVRTAMTDAFRLSAGVRTPVGRYGERVVAHSHRRPARADDGLGVRTRRRRRSTGSRTSRPAA